jgi:hypothetical protein
VFHGYLFYLQELEETFSHRQMDETRTCVVMNFLPESAKQIGIEWEDESDGWDIVIAEYTRAAQKACQAWEALRQAEPLTRTTADQQNLREEMLLTELVYRTQWSCENVLRFLQARRDFERDSSPNAQAEMRRVAHIERENALAACHIYAEAPWLDLAERTDGKFSHCADMIAAKVHWIDEYLESSE